MFGDMQIAPFFYVKNSPNFDASRWPMCTSSQVSPQSNLLANLDTMRGEHDRYIIELARHSNEVRRSCDYCGHLFLIHNFDTLRKLVSFSNSTPHYVLQVFQHQKLLTAFSS